MLTLLLRFCLLCSLCLSGPATAWNANGHRLIAGLAWERLSPEARATCGELLARHPDHPHWAEKTRSTSPLAIFAEAATWADAIRDDPRYYDEDRDPPLAPPPGLLDNRRHRHWHYVDRDARGGADQGELERQSEALMQLLHRDRESERAVWALPWLLHLIGDLHQPLHTGYAEDQGGNRFEVENLTDPRRPFTNLHSYWDQLPGRDSLRGKRLPARLRSLLAEFDPPVHGNVRLWRQESRQLLESAYPSRQGSLLPLIDTEFHLRAQVLARRRLADAGHRLGWILEEICGRGVSRETPR